MRIFNNVLGTSNKAIFGSITPYAKGYTPVKWRLYPTFYCSRQLWAFSLIMDPNLYWIHIPLIFVIGQKKVHGSEDCQKTVRGDEEWALAHTQRQIVENTLEYLLGIDYRLLLGRYLKR